MAVTADSVVVELEARTAEYNAKMNAAAAGFDRNMTKMEASAFRAGSAIGTSLRNVSKLAIGFVAVLGTQAIINAAKGGLEYAASLGEIAQSLGVSTQFLQEFRFAATQNGATIEQADGALGNLSITLGQAFNKATSGAGKAIARLGIDLKDLAKASDSERFALIADGIAKIKDPAQQSAAAIAIFGRGARDIIPTLQAGAAAFRWQAEEARQFGIILSSSQIQNADVVADKIDKLNRALSAQISGVIADNAAAIGGLANALAGVAAYALRATQNYAGFFANVQARGGLRAITDSFSAPSGRFAGPGGAAALEAKKSADLFRQAAGATRRGDAKAAKELLAQAKAARFNALAARDALKKDGPKSTGGIGDGGADLGGASPAKGGGAGKSAATGSAGKSAAEIEADFADDLSRIKEQQLQDELAITTNLDRRAEIIADLNTIEFDARLAAIKTNKDYNAKQKAALEKELRARFGREGADGEITVSTSSNPFLVAQRREIETKVFELAQEQLRDQIATLEAEGQIADTRLQRRDIDLRILALQEQQEKAALEAAIALGQIADAEKARANLASRQESRATGVSRDTESPLERYRREVAQVGNNLNDELEKIQVSGLDALNDGLVDAITGAKSLGDVFSDIADSIIKDLLRIAIQQAIIKPLANLLGGDGGGGGLLGGIIGAFGGAAAGLGGGRGFVSTLPKNITTKYRASGGNVIAGQSYLVGENGPEMWSAPQSGKIYPTGALRAMGGGKGTTVIAPQQFDLSGVVMTEDLLMRLDARNRAYADQVSATAGRTAVRASGGYNAQQSKLRG